MRKFAFSALAALGGLAMTALAAHPKTNVQLQTTTWNGQTYFPVRYAPVEISPDLKTVTVVGPWIEQQVGPRDGMCSTAEAFDAADQDWPTGAMFPTIDPVGNRCALPASSRYYFGAAYNNPNSVDDMTVIPAANGKHMFEGAVSMFKGAAERTLVVVALFEDVGDPTNCGFDTNADGIPDVPARTQTSGFILDYGVTGGPGGYGNYILDVCGDPAGWIAPADGTGGMLLRVFKSGVDTNGDGIPDMFVFADLATVTQPMLWFNYNKNAAGMILWANPGTQTFIHFDDDNPFNGVFDLGDADGDTFSDECYGYIFGLTCPGFDPAPAIAGGQLGTAVLWLYSAPACSCTGDINTMGTSNGVIDLSDLTALLSAFGGPVPTPCYDLNSSGTSAGVVDLSDLTLLLSRFGTHCN